MPDSLIIAPSRAPCPKLRGATQRRSSRQSFSPTRFVDEIAAALQPLKDGSGCYKSGNEEKLVAALKPLMGDFTVADACLVAESLWDQTWVIGVPNNTSRFLGTAYFLLRDFICCASPTSARDAGARAHFYREVEKGIDQDNFRLIARTMSEDVGDILSGDYSGGQLFGGDEAFPDQDVFEPQTWWARRSVMLRRLQEVAA